VEEKRRRGLEGHSQCLVAPFRLLLLFRSVALFFYAITEKMRRRPFSFYSNKFPSFLIKSNKFLFYLNIYYIKGKYKTLPKKSLLYKYGNLIFLLVHKYTKSAGQHRNHRFTIPFFESI
jgi:hypothetical protein